MDLVSRPEHDSALVTSEPPVGRGQAPIGSESRDACDLNQSSVPSSSSSLPGPPSSSSSSSSCGLSETPPQPRADFLMVCIVSGGSNPPENLKLRHFHHLYHTSFQFTAQSSSSSNNACTRDHRMGRATAERAASKFQLRVLRSTLAPKTTDTTLVSAG
jgi:hypothetical protein